MKTGLTLLLLCTLAFGQTMNVHTSNGIEIFDLIDVDSITFRLTPDSIPVQGLVAHYPFNGNANDASGGDNNGILVGDPQLATDRHGKPNSAYKFDADGDYISVGKPTASNPESISQSLWFRTTEEGTTGPGWDWVLLTCRHQDDGSDWPTIGVGNQRVVCSADDRNTDGSGYPPNETLLDDNTVNVSDGAWHHVCGIRDGDRFITYVDGQKAKVFKIKKPMDGSNGDMHIGHHGAWGSFFKGTIDDVRIYERVLSESEIRALYAEKP